MHSAAAATQPKSMGADKWNLSYYPSGADAAAVNKQWYIIDAEGQTLGRLASLTANVLRGKDQVCPAGRAEQSRGCLADSLLSRFARASCPPPPL